MKSGIYKILNKFTGKFYIGGSANINIRFYDHIRKLNKNIHENKYLQRAFNKEWTNPFIFTVIEYCEKDKLKEREQFWLDFTKCYDPEIGYNLFKFARSALGHKQTEEHKKKISEANKGKIISDETRKKISEKNKGYKHTKENKILIGLAAKGRHHNLGRKLTDEHKRKLSLYNKGKIIKRNIDKWPHELGHKCKCNECKQKRNLDRNVGKKNRRKIRNDKIINFKISNYIQSIMSFSC